MQTTPFRLSRRNKMRLVSPINIIVVTVLFFLLTSVSLAELPELPSVPTGLNEYTALELNRSWLELEKSRSQLNQEIKRFDAKCVNRVRDGDLLVEECTRWEQYLQTRVNDFSDQFNEFRRAVKRAETAEPSSTGKLQTKEVPSPKVPVAGVITSLKGTVEMKTPKGWVPVDKLSKFSPGTELRAGPDGHAKILIKGKRQKDGSYSTDAEIILKPGSSFIFNDPTKEKSKGDKLKGLFEDKRYKGYTPPTGAGRG